MSDLPDSSIGVQACCKIWKSARGSQSIYY